MMHSSQRRRQQWQGLRGAGGDESTTFILRQETSVAFAHEDLTPQLYPITLGKASNVP